mmetsp:Transcript_99312/g.195043  ORF Transcript_99312/g.195043 Transcript_99312/m.195043 type:complete len:136 (+) Transcript_99312:60-467(+)
MRILNLRIWNRGVISNNKFKNSSNTARIFPDITPDGQDNEMNCCGLFSKESLATETISREETEERLGLVSGKPVRKVFNESNVLSSSGMEGPLTNATEEGLRLSQLRRERIMQTKPVDSIGGSVSSNMFQNQNQS